MNFIDLEFDGATTNSALKICVDVFESIIQLSHSYIEQTHPHTDTREAYSVVSSCKTVVKGNYCYIHSIKFNTFYC